MAMPQDLCHRTVRFPPQVLLNDLAVCTLPPHLSSSTPPSLRLHTDAPSDDHGGLRADGVREADNKMILNARTRGLLPQPGVPLLSGIGNRCRRRSVAGNLAQGDGDRAFFGGGGRGRGVPGVEAQRQFVFGPGGAQPADEPGPVELVPGSGRVEGGSLAVLSAARVAADGGPSPSNCDQSVWLIGARPPPCSTQCQVRATRLLAPNSSRCRPMRNSMTSRSGVIAGSSGSGMSITGIAGHLLAYS
jgi:hypothetical protein